MALPTAPAMKRRARRLVPVTAVLAVTTGTIALVDGTVDLTERWEVAFIWFTFAFGCVVATAAPGPLPRATSDALGTEADER